MSIVEQVPKLFDQPWNTDTTASITCSAPRLDDSNIPSLPPPRKQIFRHLHLHHNRNKSLPTNLERLPSQQSSEFGSIYQKNDHHRRNSPNEDHAENNNNRGGLTLSNENLSQDKTESTSTFSQLESKSPVLFYVYRFQLTMGKLTLPSVCVPYIWPTSPSSFFTGVLTGLFIAYIRPTLEFYLDMWARYVSTIARFIILWGTVLAICWSLLRLIQTGAEKINTNQVEQRAGSPMSETESNYIAPSALSNYSEYSGYSHSSHDSDSSYSRSFESWKNKYDRESRLDNKHDNVKFTDLKPTEFYKKYDKSPLSKDSNRSSTPASDYTYSSISPSSSASNYGKKEKPKKKEEDYAYRPYPPRPTLAQQQSEEMSSLSKNDHISVLEKPSGQAAFRIQRK